MNTRTASSLTLPCATVPKSSVAELLLTDESSDADAWASTRPESSTALAVVSRSFELTVSVPVLTPTDAVAMPSACTAGAALAAFVNEPAGAVKPALLASEYWSVAAGGAGRSSTLRFCVARGTDDDVTE